MCLFFFPPDIKADLMEFLRAPESRLGRGFGGNSDFLNGVEVL